MRTRLFSSILLLILVLSLPLPFPVKAQTEIQVLNNQPVYTFGEQINFQATIQSTQPIAEVLVSIRTGDQTDTKVIQATIDPQGKVSAVLDLRQQPLRAFSNVDYWYQVTFEDGKIITSPG